MSKTAGTSTVIATAATEPAAAARIPLLVLVLSSALWLLVSSVAGFIASLQFHKPDLAANCPALSYGRVHAVASCAFLYGFCLQAGLAFALWLFSRLGRIRIAQPILLFVGAKLWNLGVTVGIIGIFIGDSTGFEGFEMPRYASPFLLLGYLVIAVFAILTFHQRSVRGLYVSQWFLLAALFWFAWIFSTAALLLLTFPVRGMGQAVIAWWYANNLQVVWLGLVGLAAIFYFLPRLSGKDLYSRPLALIAFWGLILLGSWGGIPNSAPVPAWIPAASASATLLMAIPALAVALNLYSTSGCLATKAFKSEPNPSPESAVPVKFLALAGMAFVLSTLLNSITAIQQVSQFTDFTWFVTAKSFLSTYGFFAMAMFGAVYYLIPTLFPGQNLCPKLMRLHFLVAVGGIVFTFFPFLIGGLVQGAKLTHSSEGFIEILKGTLMFLRVSTLGDLLLLAGHAMFFLNITGLAVRVYRAHAMKMYEEVTATVATTGVSS